MNIFALNSTRPTSVPPTNPPRVSQAKAASTTVQGIVAMYGTSPQTHMNRPPTTITPEIIHSGIQRGVSTATVAASLGMVTQDTTRFLLKQETKEKLFKNHKFVDDEDLNFSNDPGSICRQLASKLKIPPVQIELWWNDQRKGVLGDFHNHRNNVIKAIHKAFQGKTTLHSHHLLHQQLTDSFSSLQTC